MKKLLVALICFVSFNALAADSYNSNGVAEYGAWIFNKAGGTKKFYRTNQTVGQSFLAKALARGQGEALDSMGNTMAANQKFVLVAITRNNQCAADVLWITESNFTAITGRY